MTHRTAKKVERLPLVQPSRARVAELRAIERRARSSATEVQHRRLIRALKTAPLTVIDANEYLGVLQFWARVTELKEAGHLFRRRWVRQITGLGRTRRVVEIALVKARKERLLE